MYLRRYARAMLGLLAITLLIGNDVYAAGPGGRINPHRPNPPGPNNPIGSHNPAVSNPLSSLNPMTPFSNNQIVMRQLLSQQTGVSGAANRTTLSYTLMPNSGFRTGLVYDNKIPKDYRLLLSNRMVFSASHPLVLERPDPMTPLSNSYAVINDRYYAISHDPANDRDLFHAWSPFQKTASGPSSNVGANVTEVETVR